MSTPSDVAPTDPYGPHAQIISSIYEFSPDALEQLAMWVEQRGIRTPLANVVGFQQLTPKFLSIGANGAAIGTTASGTFVDLAGSPSLPQLRPGNYLVWFAGRVKLSTNAQTGVLGLSINGVDPGGPFATSANQFMFNNADAITQAWMFNQSFTGEGTTLKPRWMVTGGATASIFEFSLIVLKMGN